MEQENTVQKKSFDFAVKIVKVGYQIQKERRDFDLSRQFIRSGTSIGANIEEALGSSSIRMFCTGFQLLSEKEERPSIG